MFGSEPGFDELTENVISCVSTETNDRGCVVGCADGEDDEEPGYA